MDNVYKYIGGDTIAGMVIDFYFLFLVVFALLLLVSKNRKFSGGIRLSIALFVLYGISNALKLEYSAQIFAYLTGYLPLILIVLYAPELRKTMDLFASRENNTKSNIAKTIQVKEIIADSVMSLSEKKTGALITLEHYASLDTYANKSVQLSSIISKELLETIFFNKSPLHDGAVIIRGDRVRAAAAYYEITERDQYDKTMGSRHRAALGISEQTDSLTIIVSEETGKISVTHKGIMLNVKDREHLLGYVDLFIKDEDVSGL